MHNRIKIDNNNWRKKGFNKDRLNKNIAIMLRNLRAMENKSLRGMQELTGIHYRRWDRIEKEVGDLNFPDIYKLRKVYNLSIDSVLDQLIKLDQEHDNGIDNQEVQG